MNLLVVPFPFKRWQYDCMEKGERDMAIIPHTGNAVLQVLYFLKTYNKTKKGEKKSVYFL